MRKAATLYLCGPAGVGKSEVARILAERHGYTVLSLGDECRAAAALRGLPADRATLQRLGDELRGGDDAKLARDAYEVALRLRGPVVVEGVRLAAEGEYLASRGAVGVRVAAPDVERATRLRVRDGSDQVPDHRTEAEEPPHRLVLTNRGDRAALARAVRQAVGRATLEHVAARHGLDMDRIVESSAVHTLSGWDR